MEIGKWLKVNGEAIYGTTASPFGSELGAAIKQKDSYGHEQLTSSSWVWRCTKKVTPEGTTLYLNVFDWPKDGMFVVPELKNKIDEAYLLKSNFFGGHKHLDTINGDEGVTISVPATAPDKIASVIVLKIKRQVEVE